MSEFGPNDAVRRWDGQSWSFEVASLFGIAVRFHVALLVFLAVVALTWLGWPGVVLAGAMLVALLIHELGHAATSIGVGGKLDEIILWPLGSLRGPRLQQRPIESTLVLLGGPALNLVACLFLLPALHWSGDLTTAIWDPFSIEPFWRGTAEVGSYLAFLFKANYWLAILNLLPLYPLDGGRMIREMVSVRTSQFQATFVAVMIGGVGGLVMFSLALWYHFVWVAVVGAFVLYTCLKRHRELELLADSQENEFGYDFSEGYTSLERSMTSSPMHAHPPSLSQTWRQWFEERERRKGEAIEVELDRILEKIHTSGIASLSRNERKILSQASRRRRT